MIGRLIWFGSIAALAVLVTMLQFDRQSESTPALSQFVPQPLRGYAQAQNTMRALEAGTPRRALAEAELLVRRRPIPAENLTLLAIAQAKSGDNQGAQTTIQIAGQRGWRVPVAQEAVLRLALDAGDEAEAARRYAALMLQASTPDAVLQELGPAVVGKPQGTGQRTLIDLIAATDRWHNAFLARGIRVLPPAAFTDIAEGSLAKGAQFDCPALDRSVQTVSRRDPQLGARLDAAAKRRCG